MSKAKIAVIVVVAGLILLLMNQFFWGEYILAMNSFTHHHGDLYCDNIQNN